MSVDDVWKEPEFEKASRFWKICRFIALALAAFLGRVLLGESVHETMWYVRPAKPQISLRIRAV